jgi:hypothetical protein
MCVSSLIRPVSCTSGMADSFEEFAFLQLAKGRNDRYLRGPGKSKTGPGEVRKMSIRGHTLVQRS